MGNSFSIHPSTIKTNNSMKNLKKAWNMAESAMSEQSPVLNEELMSHIAGGEKPGSGWVHSISGECNASGESCGTLADWIFGPIKRAFDELNKKIMP